MSTYPPRPKKEIEPLDWTKESTLNYYGLKSDVQEFGYLCKCGHYRHDHNIGYFALFKKDCIECLCPHYRTNRKLDRNNKPRGLST